MKNILFLLCFISYFSSLKAQINLVPNASFDTVTNCTPSIAGVYSGYVPPWDSPSDGSPDLYNSCVSVVSSSSVPINSFGYQYPHSGSGYVGECLYQNSGLREYIQVELDSVLVSQELYCASFYVTLGNSSKFACNNFGMFFSSSHIYISTTSNLNLTPQINDTSVINDTLNWIKIYGQFVAQGGEKYIVIGNFFDNSLTDTVHTNIPSGGGNAYYYIDDVDVHHCAQTGVVEVGKESAYKLYPNPNNGSMTLEYHIEGLDAAIFRIYDVSGRQVKQMILNASSTSLVIDAGELNAGIYYYTVKEGSKNVKAEKLVIVK